MIGIVFLHLIQNSVRSKFRFGFGHLISAQGHHCWYSAYHTFIKRTLCDQKYSGFLDSSLKLMIPFMARVLFEALIKMRNSIFTDLCSSVVTKKVNSVFPCTCYAFDDSWPIHETTYVRPYKFMYLERRLPY